jgi:hypothetical protein
MSVSSRRFEILLPLRFNDGQVVPDTLLVEVVLELEKQFGAVSSETQIIRGLWSKEGMTFRDELVRVFVDVPDLPEHREFFLRFKGSPQISLWPVGHLGNDLPGGHPLTHGVAAQAVVRSTPPAPFPPPGTPTPA